MCKERSGLLYLKGDIVRCEKIRVFKVIGVIFDFFCLVRFLVGVKELVILVLVIGVWFF